MPPANVGASARGEAVIAELAWVAVVSVGVGILLATVGGRSRRGLVDGTDSWRRVRRAGRVA